MAPSRARWEVRREAPAVPVANLSGVGLPRPFGTNALSYWAALCSGAAQSMFVICGSKRWLPPLSPAFLLQPGTVSENLAALFPGDDGRWNVTQLPTPSLERFLLAGRKLTDSFFLNHPGTVLRYLLEVLGLAYSSNYDLRRHLANLEAKYQFKFADRNTPIAAEIRSGRIRVAPRIIEAPDVSLTFRNTVALQRLLLAAKPDIFAALLQQDIVVEGNLTYLFKLAFLARRLQGKILGEV